MLTRAALICGRAALSQGSVRHFGVSAACYQKAAVATDPIQKLFLDKVREYNQKSKTQGGGMVEATPEDQKNLKDDLDKIARLYGATGADFVKFPTFTFQDPSLEPVGIDVTAADTATSQAEVAEEGEGDNEVFEWETP